MARLDEQLGRRVSLRSLQLLRVLVGPIVVVHLWPFIDDARHGHLYRDTFHEPYWSWYPELPRSVYVALLLTGLVTAAAMTVAFRSRAATVATAAIVGYNLLLSTTHVHNNRAVLFVVLLLLALAPATDEGPAWPLWLLRVELVGVYFGSGISKLLDHDWWSGRVTWLRVLRVEDRIPSWVPDVITDRSFHTGAAKVIILTELFIATGLWSRRTRVAAALVALCFHVAIQLTADVQTFSLLMISALVIWFEPADLAATWRRSRRARTSRC